MKVLSLVLLFVAVASANSMGQVKPEKSQCGVSILHGGSVEGAFTFISSFKAFFPMCFVKK